MTDRKARGQELRAIRKALGVTQKTLAEMLGIAKNNVARQERGECGIREPELRLARLLAQAHKAQPQPATGTVTDTVTATRQNVVVTGPVTQDNPTCGKSQHKAGQEDTTENG